MTAPRLRLLDGPTLAHFLGRAPKTIRTWASSGLLTTHGRDAGGRNLHDLTEAIALLDTLDKARVTGTKPGG